MMPFKATQLRHKTDASKIHFYGHDISKQENSLLCLLMPTLTNDNHKKVLLRSEEKDPLQKCFEGGSML
jgi:hypothetical protein